LVPPLLVVLEIASTVLVSGSLPSFWHGLKGIQSSGAKFIKQQPTEGPMPGPLIPGVDGDKSPNCGGTKAGEPEASIWSRESSTIGLSLGEESTNLGFEECMGWLQADRPISL